MLTRDSLLTKHPGIVEGTTVYGREGDKLGKIIALYDDYFMIEKGIFFPRDFTVRYGDIDDFRDGNLYLRLSKEDLEEWTDETFSGWSHTDDINQGRINAEPLPEFRDRYREVSSQRVAPMASEVDTTAASEVNTTARQVSTEETRVPIREERLEAHKAIHQTGQVKIRKIVHTEFKHFTIPVMREEVRVERVPVREGEVSAEALGSDAFEETTVNVPVMEEEVTITKRPVVREEVRISKERQTEQREVSGEIKKEEAEIQEEGEVRRRKVG